MSIFTTAFTTVKHRTISVKVKSVEDFFKLENGNIIDKYCVYCEAILKKYNSFVIRRATSEFKRNGYYIINHVDTKEYKLFTLLTKSARHGGQGYQGTRIAEENGVMTPIGHTYADTFAKLVEHFY